MGSACSGKEETTTETVVDDEPISTAATPKGDSSKTTIKVVGCRGLRNADWSWLPGMNGGLSDAYVICKQIVGTTESKELFTTKTITDSLEPIFDEDFEVDLTAGADLEFNVYDKDELKQDDFLGMCVLKEADFKKGFNAEKQLVDAGKDVDAHIKLMIKPPGGDYPKGPDATFTIKIQKSAKKELGFDYDKTAEDIIYVASVRAAGPAKEHNDKVEEDMKIKEGQYIVAVNGVTGDSKQMDTELKKKDTVELSLVRPYCFTVAIEKKGPMGMVLMQAAASNVVKELKDGPLLAWNKAHPDFEVQPGDRIAQVNGKRATGKEQMKLLEPDGPLQIVFSRRCPADSTSTRHFWHWF